MTTQCDSRARRLRGQRGASLVEFALIFPIFMTLVLGMFGFGQAYNRKNTLTNAAREGSRYGATLGPTTFVAPFTAPATHGLEQWLLKVADAVEQNADGDLAPGVKNRSICVAYYYPNGNTLDDENHALMRVTDSAGVSTNTLVHGGNPCFADGLLDTERRVQVMVSRPSPINALLFTNNSLTLTSRSVTRFEALAP